MKTETKASETTRQHKGTLFKLFAERTLNDDDLLANPGLYLRSSTIAKLLFLDELYVSIVHLPGIIMELGTWYGQNLCVFENLRAIYEPFNQTRRIVGFDTFTGYTALVERESASEVITGGGYSLAANYPAHLMALLDYHEQNNVMGHIKKHEVVVGDVSETVPKYFKDHPGDVVALAYFDLAIYKPTLAALEAILPHTIPGTVFLMDELNFRDYDGASIAFKEVFAGRPYTIRKSRYMTDRSIVVL